MKIDQLNRIICEKVEKIIIISRKNVKKMY